MSLELSQSEGIAVKTYATMPWKVYIGEYEISIWDFCSMVEYVLENTDLMGDADPRLKLIEEIKKSKTVKGFNEGRKRILTNKEAQ